MKPVLAGGDVLVETDTRTEETLDIPWNVIVHNDPINLMDYVTKVLMKIFGFPQKKAAPSCGAAHASGRNSTCSSSTPTCCSPASQRPAST